MTNQRTLLLLFTLPISLAFVPSPVIHTQWQPQVTTRSVSTRLAIPPKREPSLHCASLMPRPLSSIQRQPFTIQQQRQQATRLYVSMMNNDEGDEQMESWEDESKDVELALLVAWAVSISAFILVNNFIGPWPQALAEVPERVWFVLHMLGGMLFGGGVILTTAIEWLVAHNRNSPGASRKADSFCSFDICILIDYCFSSVVFSPPVLV